MKTLRGVAVGAGYFSNFQYEAWNRIPEVQITALCNRNQERAKETAQRHQIPTTYLWENFDVMLEREKPNFIDIITPPETHLELVRTAASKGIDIICQKPLAPGMEECKTIVQVARDAGVRLIVHENWRWQPWYREIKRQLDSGAIGKLFSISIRMRMGDGWQSDAYLARQPFFRNYPRLLIYETGVHFLDVFRFLGGEIDTIYARLQKRNPDIAGEDAGQIIAGFKHGGSAILDASRYNEFDTEDPRYTFGTTRIDGSKGQIELDTEGNLTLKLLGEASRKIHYAHSRRGFAGDCVYAFQRQFTDRMLDGGAFENTGDDYLKTVRLVEACYRSNTENAVIKLEDSNS